MTYVEIRDLVMYHPVFGILFIVIGLLLLHNKYYPVHKTPLWRVFVGMLIGSWGTLAIADWALGLMS